MKIREGRQYYMQDARQYVGNCILWWAVDSCGYTTELVKAERFTAEYIKSRSWRDTDIPWDAEVVAGACVTHVRIEPLRAAAERFEDVP